MRKQTYRQTVEETIKSLKFKTTYLKEQLTEKNTQKFKAYLKGKLHAYQAILEDLEV